MEERDGEGGSVRVKGDRYRYPFIAEFFFDIQSNSIDQITFRGLTFSSVS